jgi:hypothetical protein
MERYSHIRMTAKRQAAEPLSLSKTRAGAPVVHYYAPC